MMRNLAPLTRSRFGDTDVEPAIEIARVGVDNLSIEFRGQFNAESRLADGSRTSNDDDARAWFLRSARSVELALFGCCSLPRNLL